MFTVQIRDFEHWRKTARELLQRDICPSQVQWEIEHQKGLFGEMAQCHLVRKVIYQQVYVPAHFLSLIEQAACYRDDTKWSIFYRLAYRIAFEEKELLNAVTDSDVASLYTMCKRVSRDKHKMKAFVRFKKIEARPTHLHSSLDQDSEYDPPEHYVAWFEPTHLIVQSLAKFFTERFSNMHFTIMTPDCCMHWDTQKVHFSRGVNKPDKVHDKLEDLWCEYYANIFNPARVKLKAMQSEMPKKYWVNLPEAPLIQTLTRNATNQMDTMITRGGQQGWHKTQKSRFIQNKQKELRDKAKNQSTSD